MGLVDSVRVQSPLLAPELRAVEWQTKDLECGLDHYTITADGRLIHTITALEEVPPEQRPYWGQPEWSNPVFQGFGAYRSVPLRDEVLPYHGDICFYGSDSEKTSREFVARFTNGQLTWIKEIPVEPAGTVTHDAPPP